MSPSRKIVHFWIFMAATAWLRVDEWSYRRRQGLKDLWERLAHRHEAAQRSLALR